MLGDYHNVEAQVPDFAAKYTAGELKYATTPAALAGFQHIQEVKDAGYFNKDFASAKLNDGVKAVATGTAAHYPQLGDTANNIENVAPGKSNDVGFFALPGPDAATNGMTVWPGTAAMYIPKTVEGDKLDAAKKFIAFAATQQGCDAYSTGSRRRARSSPRRASCRPTSRRSPRTPRPTSTPARRARRWSSSRRSRARPWSRSASRSAPARWTPRRAQRSTTRTSRSRRSSWACPAGSDLEAASRGCWSFVTPPAAGLGRDRQQDLTKGLRYGEHTGHNGGDTSRARRAGIPGRAGAQGPVPILVLCSRRRSSTLIFFIVPTLSSFYFSFTRWDLFTSKWIGLKNYQTFFAEQALIIGLRNTLIYAVITSGLKVVLGMALAVLLTSKIIAAVPAVGHLLPGAGQHDRRRSHLHRVDEPRAGADQQGAWRWSASTAPAG